MNTQNQAILGILAMIAYAYIFSFFEKQISYIILLCIVIVILMLVFENNLTFFALKTKI